MGDGGAPRCLELDGFFLKPLGCIVHRDGADEAASSSEVRWLISEELEVLRDVAACDEPQDRELPSKNCCKGRRVRGVMWWQWLLESRIRDRFPTELSKSPSTFGTPAPCTAEFTTAPPEPTAYYVISCSTDGPSSWTDSTRDIWGPASGPELTPPVRTTFPVYTGTASTSRRHRFCLLVLETIPTPARTSAFSRLGKSLSMLCTSQVQ